MKVKVLDGEKCCSRYCSEGSARVSGRGAQAECLFALFAERLHVQATIMRPGLVLRQQYFGKKSCRPHHQDKAGGLPPQDVESLTLTMTWKWTWVTT